MHIQHLQSRKQVNMDHNAVSGMREMESPPTWLYDIIHPPVYLR